MKRLSISSAKQFMRCGEQYRLRQELGPMAPGIALIKGRGLDKAANKNNAQKWLSREDLPVDELEAEARDEVVLAFHDAVALTDEERMQGLPKIKGETIDGAVKLTRVYHRNIAPKVQPGKVVAAGGVEIAAQQVRLEADLGGVELVGVLDLIDEDGVVRDLKSASKMPAKNAAATSPQLAMYGLLNRARSGSEFQRAALDTVVVTSSGGINYDQQEVRSGPVEQAAMLDRLVTIKTAIDREVFIPTDPSNWWCSERFCGFYGVCKYVQKGAHRAQD